MSFFIYNEPVFGSGYFFGREQLLRSLDDGVHRGRSFALCGGPKSGRTSTLLHLAHRMRERWRRQPRTPKTVPVTLRLADTAQRGAREAPKHLWQTIRSS